MFDGEDRAGAAVIIEANAIGHDAQAKFWRVDVLKALQVAFPGLNREEWVCCASTTREPRRPHAFLDGRAAVSGPPAGFMPQDQPSQYRADHLLFAGIEARDGLELQPQILVRTSFLLARM